MTLMGACRESLRMCPAVYYYREATRDAVRRGDAEALAVLVLALADEIEALKEQIRESDCIPRRVYDPRALVDQVAPDVITEDERQLIMGLTG